MSKEHLSEKELSSRWHVSRRTLQRWRAENKGAAYIKVGSCVRYPLDAVEMYELTHTNAISEVSQSEIQSRNSEGLSCVTK